MPEEVVGEVTEAVLATLCSHHKLSITQVPRAEGAGKKNQWKHEKEGNRKVDRGLEKKEPEQQAPSANGSMNK